MNATRAARAARAVNIAAFAAVCVAASSVIFSASAQTSIEERRQRMAAHNAASGNVSNVGDAGKDSIRIKEALNQDNTGLTYRKNGDIDKAIAAYAKAIALDSTKNLFYRHRGEAFVAKGDKAAAMRDFSSAIKFGRDAYDYNRRGGLYMDAEDYDAAIKDYTEAVRLSPGNAEYKDNLAAVKAKRGTIKIAFTSPRTASRSGYAVGACVTSESRKIDRVVVTVNGSA